MKKVYVSFTSAIPCNYDQDNVPTRVRLTVWARTNAHSFAVITELNEPYWVGCEQHIYERARKIKAFAEGVFAENGYVVEGFRRGIKEKGEP